MFLVKRTFGTMGAKIVKLRSKFLNLFRENCTSFFSDTVYTISLEIKSVVIYVFLLCQAERGYRPTRMADKL